MLWSMIKIIIFVALVAALALAAGYLMEAQGGLQITVGGFEYSLTALQSVLLAAVLIVLAYVFFKILSLLVAVLKFINGDETAISRYFDRNRERKGFQALSEGLMALASGEGRLAMAKAAKADRYLHKPELTDLITAQAAEMIGDRKKAEEVYKRLVQRDGTRFVGVRGLMKQKLEAGDTDTALKLAERAFAIKPKHEEVQDTLLELQARDADWDGARKTLAAKLKSGAMPRDLYRRRDAVLALSEAKDVFDEGKSVEARESAIAANKSSPDLIPAAAMAARSYVANGKPKNALRILKKAWEAQPHPDLARAFAEIEPEETPQQRLTRFRTLTSINPDHRETRLLLAELHLAAEDFPGARRAIGKLPETEPDSRVLTIMAAIERGEGASEQVVRGWLAKALTSPRGPQWVCDKCNNIHAEWVPICGNCSGFDTLSWKAPPQNSTVLPAGAEMLPLIVGALEDHSRETAHAENAADDATVEMGPNSDVEDAVTVDDADPADSDVTQEGEERSKSAVG